MNRVFIDDYKTCKRSELVDLWSCAFGDEEKLIEKFFHLLPEMGRGFVAIAGGKLIGMAYVLNFTVKDEVFGYLYALAVKEEYRGNGIGQMLVKHCLELYPRLCTFPANKNLYKWYDEKCGMKYRTYCVYDRIESESAVEFKKAADSIEYLFGDGEKRNDYLTGVKKSETKVVSLSSADYAGRRSQFSIDTRYPVAWYEYQRELCRTYGGGMFAFGRSIACGYKESETVNGRTVKVLKIGEYFWSSDFIPMLCDCLDADYAMVRRVAFKDTKNSSPFICANVPIPDTLAFGLALD